MKFHPSFGPVPAEKFREAEQAPAIKTAQIIRKFDPLFGLVKGNDKLRSFSVECSRLRTVREWATVEIEARDKDHAEQLALAMPMDAFDWTENHGSEDWDDFTVEQVK